MATILRTGIAFLLAAILSAPTFGADTGAASAAGKSELSQCRDERVRTDADVCSGRTRDDSRPRLPRGALGAVYTDDE